MTNCDNCIWYIYQLPTEPQITTVTIKSVVPEMRMCCLGVCRYEGGGRRMTNEEAIKILKSKMDGSVDTSYEWAETVRMAIKALDEPERKKGEWIINSDGYYPYCSECRKEPKSGDMTDFCPNCGADMREPEDIPMEYFESGGK